MGAARAPNNCQVVQSETHNSPKTSQRRNKLSLNHNRLLTARAFITLVTTLAGLSHAGAQGQGDVMPQHVQHNNILKFEVYENAPNNTLIGNIRAQDGQLPYLVVAISPTSERELKAAFNIDFSTGDLTTNSVLDREHREQYHFVAIMKTFVEIKCTVTVKDVNDNGPIFLTQASNETNFVIEMPEGQRGIRKVLPLAVDFDTPQFGIKEFSIVSGNTPSGLFDLVEHGAPPKQRQNANQGLASDDSMSQLVADNPQLMQQLTTTVLIPSQPVVQPIPSAGIGNNQMISQSAPSSQANGANNPQAASHSRFLIDLEVSQPLDRENQSSYQLVVQAIDGGQPPLLGKLMVTVNVLDVNDNDPVFRQKAYDCQVNESAPKGTLIIKVQADDIDLDSNGQVSYFIKSHSSSSQPLNLINSDPSDSYNNEAQSRYSTTNGLILNNGNNKQRLPQQTQVLSYNKLTQRQNSNIDLHTNSPQDLSNSAQPHKLRQSNLLTYPPDQFFDINQATGEIYLVNQLDYETNQSHDLVIEARDQGKPSRNSTTVVRVHVLDVLDEPPKKTVHEEKAPVSNNQFGESSRLDSPAINPNMDALYSQSFNLRDLNLSNWFAQMNSIIIFCCVFGVLFIVGFSVCLVRVKSRQPESDYNDTAGLTPSPNNTQTKPSPNHSSSNLDHPMGGDSAHYRHHDHQRRPNGSFAGLNGSSISGAFGTPNGKMSRYPCITDSSNLYHNLFPTAQRSRHHSSTSHHMQPDSPVDHQMVVGQGDSRGGTLALHNHHHHHLLGHSPPGHHSLEHNHHNHHSHQYPGPNHTTSSLTYAHHHSRAALLQHAHHHQSSHQLSTVHQGVSHKGGTMNSHHSAHPPSGSPVPATPNTTHSSGLPVNMHEASSYPHNHRVSNNPLVPTLPTSHQGNQLPPTPCRSGPGGMFVWPPSQGPGSTVGCFASINGLGGLHGTPGSTMDSCGTASGVQAVNSQPLDRWFDLGVSSQLIYPHDWASSYDWDYLDNWQPEHHNLMPLIQAEASGF